MAVNSVLHFNGNWGAINREFWMTLTFIFVTTNFMWWQHQGQERLPLA